MELQHLFTVPAPVGTTWETFMDLAGVAGCFPGATVTSVEGDRFQGTCKVKLGPIALTYAGSGTFLSRDDEAHRAVVQATGKDKRGNGTARATVTIALSTSGEAATAVEVSTDLNVTGKPAQFGRSVLQDVSDRLLQQFVACLEQRFAGQPEPTSAEPAAEAVRGSAEAEVAPEPAQAEVAPEPAQAEVAPEPVEPDSMLPPVRPAAPPARPRLSNVDKPAFVRAGVGGGEHRDSVDLGAAVVPVLLKAYAPHLAAAAVGFVLGVLVARSRRH